MKTVARGFLALLLVFMGSSRMAGQVFDVNQFKVTVYNQTDAAPPIAPANPNSYYFGTYIDTDAAYDVTNVTVYLPNNDEIFLNQYTSTYFEYGSPYYSDETNFDTDFPGGACDYNYTFTDAASNVDNVDIIFNLDTNDLYATAIPAFTPACWTAMQAVDPAQDFTLSWNAYTLTPGADYAETFLSISDQTTGDAVIGPSGPPEITSTNIPGGTLEYGQVYNVSIYFSERQNPPDFGFGNAFITVGWDNLTQTTMTTLPLLLHISPAGTNVTLAWPVYAANYHLETAARLASPAAWSNVTNPPSAAGGTNVLSLPAGSSRAFYRLAAVGF